MAKRDREAVNQGLSDILGGASGSDLLGSIIERDRSRGGRVTPTHEPPSAPLPLPEEVPQPERSAEGARDPVALPVLSATGSETRSATGSQVAIPTGRERRSARSSAGGSATSSKVARATYLQAEAETENPMHAALLELLSRPYSAHAAKGPFTVTTVKIPTELWERLGWLSSLTGQAKQEILADALKGHFDRAVKELG